MKTYLIKILADRTIREQTAYWESTKSYARAVHDAEEQFGDCLVLMHPKEIGQKSPGRVTYSKEIAANA